MSPSGCRLSGLLGSLLSQIFTVTQQEGPNSPLSLLHIAIPNPGLQEVTLILLTDYFIFPSCPMKKQSQTQCSGESVTGVWSTHTSLSKQGNFTADQSQVALLMMIPMNCCYLKGNANHRTLFKFYI
jgi:hypothetical protein